MVLKLYGVSPSTNVQRVLTTLHEKNLQYQLIQIDMMKGEHKLEAYLEKQPFGVVPVLDDDGFLIYESRAICRYLEMKYSNQGNCLIPKEDCKAIALFEQGASIEISYFDQIAGGLTIEKLFKKLYGLGETDHERVKTLTQKLSEHLDVYDKCILSKQPYIGGRDFTLADLFHLPYGSVLFHEQVGLGYLIMDRPNVRNWWERIVNRPSWKLVTDSLQ